MKYYRKAPKSIQIMLGAFYIALAFAIFFTVSNSRVFSSNSSNTETMQHANLALLLGVYAFFQLAMVGYVASFALSVWNAIKWLDRGGKYFWMSVAIFFGDAAMLAWLLAG